MCVSNALLTKLVSMDCALGAIFAAAKWRTCGQQRLADTPTLTGRCRLGRRVADHSRFVEGDFSLVNGRLRFD